MAGGEGEMADIVLTQGESLSAGTQFRYRDMSDGTHALVCEYRSTLSGGNDIVLGLGQSLPPTTRTRYADQGDGTHALVQAR